MANRMTKKEAAEKKLAAEVAAEIERLNADIAKLKRTKKGTPEHEKALQKVAAYF